MCIRDRAHTLSLFGEKRNLNLKCLQNENAKETDTNATKEHLRKLSIWEFKYYKINCCMNENQNG